MILATQQHYVWPLNQVLIVLLAIGAVGAWAALHWLRAGGRARWRRWLVPLVRAGVGFTALLAAQQVPPALNQLGMQLSDEPVFVVMHLLAVVPEVIPRRRQRRVTFRL